MRLKGLFFAGVISLVGAVALSTPASARRHGDYGYHHYHGYPRVNFDIWVGGHWRHDWYRERYGWWWVAGPHWYYYPEPIYPYPAYSAYPAYGAVAAPPAAPVGAPPEQNWYFCESPKGYYPYVSQCATAWRAVPVTPPGTVQ